MKKVLLIDGNSFCYRAFYAIRSLTNSRGEPTNAVYGFLTMLKKLVKDQAPDYLAIAFDLKGPTFRHEKFKDYKVHRKPMPDDLVSQIPIIKELLAAMNVPIYEKQGYEADDILATMAGEFSSDDCKVYIVTGDKDILQLVNDDIFVLSSNKEGLVYDRQTVKERFGVGPEGVREVLCLMGDASDNIPGIKGIGEKTAMSLISQYGTLEGILENIDAVKSSSQRKLIQEGQEEARFCRELATLDAKVPIDLKLDDLKIQEPDSGKLLELYKRLEFRRLLSGLDVQDDEEVNYQAVTDKKALDKLIKELSSAAEISFDFETTSAIALLAELVGVSFAIKPKEAFYVPVSVFGAKEIIDYFKEIFENKNIAKIGHNLKYEMTVLDNYGVTLQGKAFDTMIASYLLDPARASHSLAETSLRYLSKKMTPIEDLIGKGKNQRRMDEVDLEQITDYACADSDVALRLKNILAQELKKQNLNQLFYNIEMPLVSTLTRIEINGVKIDKEMLGILSEKFSQEIAILEKKIYQSAGEEFNIKSPKQLSEILFVKLKLPVVKKTKTGFSTNVEVLEKLSQVHDLPADILKYRELAKLKSTYLDALPELINPNTKRIHTSFNQTVTATGRLSSSRPNLQNIPTKTVLGREIRKAFIAEDKDNLILAADYSQIELRILAHISGDKQLIDAFKKDHDIHRYTAKLIFDVKEKDVTKSMRESAKTVNFGIIYGMSAYGLSKALSISPPEAEEFIDNYFARYPAVRSCMDDTIARAREDGFVLTIFNRRRYVPEINASNHNVQQFAERVAINAPIQGTASDLIKIAMINIQDKLKNKKSRMIMQVHDELVFEVPKDELDEVQAMIRAEMEGAVKLKVPLKVDMHWGKSWYEAK